MAVFSYRQLSGFTSFKESDKCVHQQQTYFNFSLTNTNWEPGIRGKKRMSTKVWIDFMTGLPLAYCFSRILSSSNPMKSQQLFKSTWHEAKRSADSYFFFKFSWTGNSRKNKFLKGQEEQGLEGSGSQTPGSRLKLESSIDLAKLLVYTVPVRQIIADADGMAWNRENGLQLRDLNSSPSSTNKWLWTSSKSLYLSRALFPHIRRGQQHLPCLSHRLWPRSNKNVHGRSLTHVKQQANNLS